MSCPSVCPRGSRVRFGDLGSGSLEKYNSCLEFSNPTTWERRCGAITAFFQDNIGLLVHKTFVSKNDSFCLEIFQIQLLGEEIWGNNCIFQDNIGVWVLKMFVSKITPFCLGIY